MNIFWLLFSFNGRISRLPFWAMTAILLLPIIFPLSFISSRTQVNAYDGIMTLLLLWPSLAVQAKRWHDRNKSAWWILINLVPLIGSLWAFIENGFLPGTKGENRFGADPADQNESAQLKSKTSQPNVTMNDVSTAIKQYEEAIDLDDNRSESYFMCAMAYNTKAGLALTDIKNGNIPLSAQELNNIESILKKAKLYFENAVKLDSSIYKIVQKELETTNMLDNYTTEIRSHLIE